MIPFYWYVLCIGTLLYWHADDVMFIGCDSHFGTKKNYATTTRMQRSIMWINVALTNIWGNLSILRRISWIFWKYHTEVRPLEHKRVKCDQFLVSRRRKYLQLHPWHNKWVNRNKELRLCDSLCAGDNSIKMCIFCMQNVKQIFADLWLKNEVGDVPADQI